MRLALFHIFLLNFRWWLLCLKGIKSRTNPGSMTWRGYMITLFKWALECDWGLLWHATVPREPRIRGISLAFCETVVVLVFAPVARMAAWGGKNVSNGDALCGYVGCNTYGYFHQFLGRLSVVPGWFFSKPFLSHSWGLTKRDGDNND